LLLDFTCTSHFLDIDRLDNATRRRDHRMDRTFYL